MRLLALAAVAGAMLGATPVFAEVVEADRFICVNQAFDNGSEAGASSALLVGASFARARSVWFVRDASVRADGAPAPWCPDISFQAPRSEACRTDGPALPSGPLTLQVTETLRGAKARTVEVRMSGASRGAFLAGSAEAGAPNACEQGSVAEEIAGESYFSPYLAALHPKREFALVITRQEDGAETALAIALPDQPDAAKRQLRQLARMR